MDNANSRYTGYALAALLGAMGGALFVVLATRGIPKIMSRMMSGRMRKMMAQMKASGCDPAEI